MSSKKQRQVAQAIFEGQMGMREILDKFNLTPVIFERWLQTDEFQRELECWRKLRELETEFTIHRYGPLAALKLAELLGSEKPDTVRRAAVDLINRCLGSAVKTEGAAEDKNEPELTDQQAREMVLTLAESMREDNS